MNETDYDKLNKLAEKLDLLLKRQESFSHEVFELQSEIRAIKAAQKNEQLRVSPEGVTPSDDPAVPAGIPIIEKKVVHKEGIDIYRQFKEKQAISSSQPALKPAPGLKTDLEKFIGENLISKIGIAITVIGVAIGAKYSIEHELISPLMRIVLGYLAGFILLSVGIRLKKKYLEYSAVLVSGSIAIMYFITYAAYGFYGLFPQSFAFGLMLVFTALTVFAAIKYNKVVIAHVGLVGAYALPFLLSNGSGRIEVLFTYMAIINVGILAIAFRKYWKSLYYAAFILTWAIFSFWFASKFDAALHFRLALIFASIFFITFYITFLAYKLVRKEQFKIEDILLLLSNSFIFYGLGYGILYDTESGRQITGLFTICNAVIHFMVSFAIYRQKLADRNLFYLVTGLFLIFITIAIPVQLHANWITLLWSGEAALLFWIGRRRGMNFYEKISYPLMVFAFMSLAMDWAAYGNNFNGTGKTVTPFLNINFFSSLIFIIFFVLINIVNRNSPFAPARKNSLTPIMSYVIPLILLFTIYYTFRMEIEVFFLQKQFSLTQHADDISIFKSIWIINYTLFYLSLLSFVNRVKIKSQNLGMINIVLNTMAIIFFLTEGLYKLSELRDSYVSTSGTQAGAYNIGIRYISFAFVAWLLYTTYRYVRQFLVFNFHIAFDILLHGSILWVASSELINWMDISKPDQSYKLGLSILWGCYSLLLIMLGIWKKKKHLRIGAIVLFGVTLLKLFFYDLVDLDTISKTIVFVSLGVLLLIISFLYNKYKHIIN